MERRGLGPSALPVRLPAAAKTAPCENDGQKARLAVSQKSAVLPTGINAHRATDNLLIVALTLSAIGACVIGCGGLEDRLSGSVRFR